MLLETEGQGTFLNFVTLLGRHLRPSMLQQLLRRLVFDVPLLIDYCKMPLRVNTFFPPGSRQSTISALVPFSVVWPVCFCLFSSFHLQFLSCVTSYTKLSILYSVSLLPPIA